MTILAELYFNEEEYDKDVEPLYMVYRNCEIVVRVL